MRPCSTVCLAAALLLAADAALGEQPAALWLSMVDNLTGDATFVPFTNFDWWTHDYSFRAAVPVVVHGPGEGGTQWQTDLYGALGVFYNRPTAMLQPSEPARNCGGAATVSEIRAELDGEVGMPLDVWMATQGVTNEEQAKDTWHRLPGRCQAFRAVQGRH